MEKKDRATLEALKRRIALFAQGDHEKWRLFILRISVVGSISLGFFYYIEHSQPEATTLWSEAPFLVLWVAFFAHIGLLLTRGRMSKKYLSDTPFCAKLAIMVTLSYVPIGLLFLSNLETLAYYLMPIPWLLAVPIIIIRAKRAA